MFMSKENNLRHDLKSNQKQIKIPEDGQLSKEGTVVKDISIAKEVDYSIAEIVGNINQAGFKSIFSCSGLKKDHPLKDVKQDGAYISFLNQDNDTETLAFIRKAATHLDLTAEECRINRLPALLVRIDKDIKGNSLSDRIRIANESISYVYSYNRKRPYGACTKDLEIILQQNGGLVYDTDEKIQAVWKKFEEILLGFSYQNVG